VKKRPLHFYLSTVVPTSSDYFEIHNHEILRSIQEIIKMHALFYVNDVGLLSGLSVADSMGPRSTPFLGGRVHGHGFVGR
jgi:hypothetical protein